jgi:SAM-dependent methyltransferase
VTKLTWAAPERNKQPILDVLERVLPPAGTLLEIASGTGQHAVHFAGHLTRWTIQPSDVAPENLTSIEARRIEAGLPNLLAPLHLDVCTHDWQLAPVPAIFNANLIHIAPWEVALGLLRGAARHLLPGGTLIVYGPFKIGGIHTAPSNQSFDASLREQDLRFGVRDLEAVLSVAAEHGLTLRERIEMPANNQTLVMTRGPATGIRA